MNRLARIVAIVMAVFAAPGNVLSADAQRVVSVGGAVTEIMFALGIGDYLVGVDTTSVWPAAATKLPQVGYQRNLSAEGILSLQPTVVVATADAGPDEVLQQLRDAGIHVRQFQREYTLDSVYERVRMLGIWFDRKSEAQELIASIRSDYQGAGIHTVRAESPGVIFLLGTEAGSALAAGTNTSADAMIEFAGGENKLSGFAGYKPVSAEALIKAAPEYIAVVEYGGASSNSVAESVLQLPGVAMTPAGRRRHIIVLDGLRFLGFGPRIGIAISEFSAALDPLLVVQ